MLASGYPLPFGVFVPRRAGFLAGARGEIAIAFRTAGPQSTSRLQRALEVFTRLGRSGALSGASISPGRSNLELRQGEARGLEHRFIIDHAAVDDRSIVVLAHLLYTQRQWLDLDAIRVLVEGESQYVRLNYDSEEHSTYPASYAALPFPLADEEPETNAVTWEVLFRRAPAPDTLRALAEGFKAWSDAVVRGGYALALIPPEDSHVETYDDELIVVGNVVERSYHKLTADDAALAAVVNIVMAIHERQEPVAAMKIS